MTGYLTGWDGTKLQLPELLEWTLEYTCGTPCDSFWIKSVWSPEQEAYFRQAVEFTAVEVGEIVFRGRVDEVAMEWGNEGRVAEISGRGMAALLLDNEAVAVEYQSAGLEDILRNHVTPYGIQVAQKDVLPVVPGFSVAAGSSEWKVLTEFAGYYAGISPRFDPQGRLVIAAWKDGKKKYLGDSVPVTSITCKEKRYGVFSQVWVRDKSQKTMEKVKNPTFMTQGGCCRRVITMPGKSSYKAMRYSGEYQLKQSELERRQMTVVVAQAFWARPGELIELVHSAWKQTGTWRVAEAKMEQTAKGRQTVLTLRDPE